MKTWYTVHFHGPEGLGLFAGACSTTTHAERYLRSKGHGVSQQNISQYVSGKRWSRKFIIIPHERPEEEPITVEMIADLKLRGTKSAEALLSERKRRAQQIKSERKTNKY